MAAFGDNLRDLPLFAACNASYAVSNAHKLVRIGSSAEDMVACFLLKQQKIFMNKK